MLNLLFLRPASVQRYPPAVAFPPPVCYIKGTSSPFCIRRPFMELRTLKSFLAVAQEENITRAARALHVTQPSLSRQIMQLEQSLGVKLFHRGKYSMTLTEHGRLLKRRAQEILALASRAERELAPGEQPVSGEIAIGCGETRNLEILSRLMADFQREYPDVRFDLYTATADDVKERMESGLADLGLLVEPVEIANYHFLKLPLREKWCLLLPADSPLAKKAALSPADLANQRLILTRRKSVQNELENWLGAYYPQVRLVATSNLSYYNRMLMVKSGLGVAACHEFSLTDPTLCLRPLTPELSNGSVLIWKKSQEFSPAVEAFLSFLSLRLPAGIMQNSHFSE